MARVRVLGLRPAAPAIQRVMSPSATTAAFLAAESSASSAPTFCSSLATRSTRARASSDQSLALRSCSRKLGLSTSALRSSTSSNTVCWPWRSGDCGGVPANTCDSASLWLSARVASAFIPVLLNGWVLRGKEGEKKKGNEKAHKQRNKG